MLQELYRWHPGGSHHPPRESSWRLADSTRHVVHADRTIQPRPCPCSRPGDTLVRRREQTDGHIGRLRTSLVEDHAAHARFGDASPGKAGNEPDHHVHLCHRGPCRRHWAIGQDQLARLKLNIRKQFSENGREPPRGRRVASIQQAFAGEEQGAGAGTRDMGPCFVGEPDLTPSVINIPLLEALMETRRFRKALGRNDHQVTGAMIAFRRNEKWPEQVRASADEADRKRRLLALSLADPVCHGEDIEGDGHARSHGGLKRENGNGLHFALLRVRCLRIAGQSPRASGKFAVKTGFFARGLASLPQLLSIMPLAGLRPVEDGGANDGMENQMRRKFWAAALAYGWATAAAAQPVSSDLSDYARPHEQVEIEANRHLNLFCMGSGDRTVLFEAGGSDWSVVRAKVQPLVARNLRACAYDRAGLGYSEEARGPRSPVAIAEDLHVLIGKADLKTPLILVGHSLGGSTAKLHAALFPGDVAGLVLIEPSEERAWDRTRTLIRARFGAALAARAELGDRDVLGMIVGRYAACRQAAQASGDLDPASTLYRRCSDPPRTVLGDQVAAERQRLQVKVRYQLAQASEIENSIYGTNATDPAYARLFTPGVLGDRPLILLTRTDAKPEDDLDAVDIFQTAELQRQTIALSRRGSRRTVAGVSHHIELDAPEVAAQAITDVAAILSPVSHHKRPRPRSSSR